MLPLWLYFFQFYFSIDIFFVAFLVMFLFYCLNNIEVNCYKSKQTEYENAMPCHEINVLVIDLANNSFPMCHTLNIRYIY